MAGVVRVSHPCRSCPRDHYCSVGKRSHCVHFTRYVQLKSNRDKQIKLTDLYLKNLLSEDTFKEKNESLRQEEEALRSKLAGIELFLLEKENSAAYLDKVKEFLASYDSEKKEPFVDAQGKIDVAAQKQILGLLFKKIIIKNVPRLRSAQAAADIILRPTVDK